MACVYFIRNSKNLKLYIGATSGQVEFRLKCHKNAATKQNVQSKFYNAIRKHTESCFEIHAVIHCGEMDAAFALESNLIRLFQSKESGYNTAHGGKNGMRKDWTIAGVTYESKTAAALAFGIYPPKMFKRLALGHTPEQAVGIEPLPTWKVGEIVIAGIRYSSRTAAAKAYGISPDTVKQRINKLGWSLEQAVGIPAPEGKRKNGIS